VLRQRVVALPPLDRPAAEQMLSRLPAGELLDGVRGMPAADRKAVCAALLSLSALAQELGNHIEALDVNPLIVTPAGATAVDALIVPKAPSGTQAEAD
jgi:hypothetical protein